MRVTRRKKRTVEIVVDVLCNKCGGSCVPKGRRPDDAYGPHGLIEAEVVGGYDSPVLPDGTTYQFSLCEGCLSALFATFVHDPRVP
jgi:hypothetical protein